MPIRNPIDLAFKKKLVITVAVATVWLGSVVLLGWWASSEIDDQAKDRQASRAQIALAELFERVPKEQDSSAVWDDAVLAVRAADADFLAENLVEWMSAYYGHERVYVLDPSNAVIRASVDGLLAAPSVFDAEAGAIMPLVEDLRSRMAEASEGEEDSTDAVFGMGAEAFASFSGGSIGLISIRPILPETDKIQQRAGEEYLHVSVEKLDQPLLAEIGTKFGLSQVGISLQPPMAGGAIPVVSRTGENIAWLTWVPDKPAAQLIQRTAPMLLIALIFGAACFILLLWRLRRTASDLQQSQAHAMHLAFHDQLTGLPNRALFEDRLERAITANLRGDGCTVLHYLDLDRFKHVNDTLGHPSGDELVRQVAARLQSVVREADTVARIGGDEFAIVQVDAHGEADVNRLCERLLGSFDKPFILHGEEIKVSASIGAALQRKGHRSPADLMRQADVALYDAKAAGKGRHRIFAGEMDDVLKRRRQLEKDLRNAIETGTELKVVYQPIYSAADNCMVGAEALARWRHTTQGPIAPDLFIKLAEERGLIERLGNFVLREACAFAVSKNLPWIAVNFSPIQFRDGRLSERIAAILAETGLAPERLQIEVTEGVLLQNSPAVQETIKQIREQGICVALDDFGTGYSSISYLRTYGVDKLKIDRSFVAQLGTDDEADSIVRAIIDLAKAMRMTVTAEGVETTGQLDILRSMGCTELQGYLLSKPIAGEQVSEYNAVVTEQLTA